MTGGKTRRIYIYDTTLRDGAQTSGVSFSLADKMDFLRALHNFGVDYAEAGWPGANEIDTSVFARCFDLRQNFAGTKITAFGMTKKHDTSIHNDPVLAGLVNSRADFFCIVGKSWDFHVVNALGISLLDNLIVIEESVKYLKTKAKEVLFDAEHFFDGYKANPKYALDCLKAALKGGADWLVLCDTNGGMLPDEVFNIVSDVVSALPDARLGIHTHNDTECAVANSIAAVQAGVNLVQGTINGLGERCGNANLCSIIPNLVLKMGLDCGVAIEDLKNLPSLSQRLDDILNKEPQINLPYVGASAFVHKGGLHASAVLKNPATYEHVDPSVVGNVRKIPTSNQAGKANIVAMLHKIGLKDEKYTSKAADIASFIKLQEAWGYSYENADASFELLVASICNQMTKELSITSYNISTSFHYLNKEPLANAIIELNNSGQFFASQSYQGPVDAAMQAVTKAVLSVKTKLQALVIADYKVKIISGDGVGAKRGSASKVKVDIKFAININETTCYAHTTGVASDVIGASLTAIMDGYNYALLKAANPA